MPTVLLIRHAQASFGARAYDVLSTRGMEQAELLAVDLARRGVGVNRIVTGRLARQRDTVAPLESVTGISASVDRRWDEYDADGILCHFSESSARLEHPSSDGPELTPRAFQDLLETALLAWIGSADGAPTAETWPAFYSRTNDALDDLARELDRGDIAVVCTSGGVLAAICVRLLDLPPRAFLEFNRVAANTGVTKVVRGDRGISLVSFNDHGHLERPDGSIITYR